MYIYTLIHSILNLKKKLLKVHSLLLIRHIKIKNTSKSWKLEDEDQTESNHSSRLNIKVLYLAMKSSRVK